MTNVNFEEVKSRVSIREVAEMLEMQYTEKDGVIRCRCPSCNKGERDVVITPEQNIFCCFSAPKKNNKFLGGDSIALVAHAKGVPIKEAGKLIAEHFGLNETKPTNEKKPVTDLTGLDESKFNLDHNHNHVTALGVSSDWAELLGIGYASKGLMGKSVGIPLRDSAGVLHGFCWYSEDKGLVFHSRFFMPIDLSE